jgi:hypothetical protein
VTHGLRVLARARRELEQAGDWYDRERLGLGRTFTSAVEVLFARIAHQPLSFPLVGTVTRRARVSPYSYSVLFVVERETVLVTGIIHNHRGPNTWQSRVREKQPGAYEARP